jgi:hypothetical protein
MFPFTLIQLVMIGLPAAQIGLVIAAMIHLRHQTLSERELLLWDVIVLFIPFGAVMTLFFFPNRSNRHPR